MSSEMETLGAASLGALRKGQAADLSGQDCRNCGTPVEGRYCSNCGQLAASFHRPIWSLIGETVTDTLALDGRVARTLPLLFFRPGRLTRHYTQGRRARYVPPFRLFLLASLLFYFTLFALVGNTGWVDDLKLRMEQSDRGVITTSQGSQPLKDLFQEDGTVDRDRAIAALTDPEELDAEGDRALNEAFDIADNPQAFINSIERWAPRLSLLLVPITILTLSILSFWRRQVYVYDHAIHALHLHSWLYLSITLFMLIAQLVSTDTTLLLIILFAIYTILYLIRSLAVSSGASHLLSLVRFVLLLWVWIASIVTLMITLLIVGAVEA